MNWFTLITKYSVLKIRFAIFLRSHLTPHKQKQNIKLLQRSPQNIFIVAKRKPPNNLQCLLLHNTNLTNDSQDKDVLSLQKGLASCAKMLKPSSSLPFLKVHAMINKAFIMSP